jgi:gliding motility-associated-like protein
MPVAGTLSGPDSVCVGNSITITASSSGGTWSFSPAGIASVAAGVVTGIAAGSVVISYVVANACDTVVATKVVFVKPLPVAAIISGPTVVCVGSSIVLTASVPGGTWSSTGGVTVSTTGTVSGLTVGTATISYAITNSCGTTVTTKIITVNPLPNAGAISGGPMVCTSNTITMSATITGGTWSCTSNASITSSGVLTGITAGTATVSYTVTNSCGTAIATTIVTINATPPAGTISGPSRVCVGATITLVESVAGGTWSSSNPAVATISATGVVSGISGGTVNITYTTSTGLCSNRATTTITVDPLAVPGTIIGDPALCALATITLTSTQPGGVWGSSGSVATISPTGVISGLAAGTIIVTYTVTNICGPMIVTKVVSVNPLPNPGIITGPHDVCIGTKITLANSIGGGTWSSSNTAVATISAAGVISTVAPGNTAITYTVTSSAGCKDTTTYFITVWPLPAPGIISGQSKVCANVTVTLHETETGGTWSVNDPRVLSIDSITGEVRAVSPGTVIITYTSAPNGGGCVNIATLPFTVYSQPPFVIKENLSNVTCKGYADASIAVFVENATGSWQFQWSTGSTAHVVSPLAPGVYSVQVTEVSTGCIAGKNYNITEPDSLSISSEVKDELCAQANGVIELKVKGGTTPYYYMWSNKATTGQVVDLPVGTYSVVVTDEHQCKKDYAAAIGDGGCPDIDVKGGLSPNGDGANDLWVIGGLEIYRNNLVLLFDKWGDKVFEQRGYNNKWDGRGTNGSYLPDGTYFYVIKLNAENGAGGKNVLTGSLLIKR